MYFLADDKQIVIKTADTSSCVMVWDRDDYLLEAESIVNRPRNGYETVSNIKVLSIFIQDFNYNHPQNIWDKL